MWIVDIAVAIGAAYVICMVRKFKGTLETERAKNGEGDREHAAHERRWDGDGGERGEHECGPQCACWQIKCMSFHCGN